MAYNKVILQGNLVKDNNLRYLPSGSAVCNNTIAVTERYKTKDGQQKEETTFLDIAIFMGSEIFNQYTRKGSKVLVDGSLKQNTWQDNNGQNRVSYSLKVDSFTFLDSKPQGQTQPQQGYQQQGYQQPQQNQQSQNYNQRQEPEIVFEGDMDSEIPF